MEQLPGMGMVAHQLQRVRGGQAPSTVLVSLLLWRRKPLSHLIFYFTNAFWDRSQANVTPRMYYLLYVVVIVVVAVSAMVLWGLSMMYTIALEKCTPAGDMGNTIFQFTMVTSPQRRDSVWLPLCNSLTTYFECIFLQQVLQAEKLSIAMGQPATFRGLLHVTHHHRRRPHHRHQLRPPRCVGIRKLQNLLVLMGGRLSKTCRTDFYPVRF